MSEYPVTTHCRVPTPPWKSRPMEGSAMPTTVASSRAMLEPSTVAARTQRPRPLDSARGSAAAPAGVAPLESGPLTGALPCPRNSKPRPGPAKWSCWRYCGLRSSSGSCRTTTGRRRHEANDADRRDMGPRGASTHHCSWVARARPGLPAGYFKMLTARATTRIPTTREMADSAIIMSFAQVLTADTSVGLNAAAVANAKWK